MGKYLDDDGVFTLNNGTDKIKVAKEMDDSSEYAGQVYLVVNRSCAVLNGSEAETLIEVLEEAFGI